jgi:hypothetical protein
MHIFILDATGSVTDDQLNAGSQYCCDILNDTGASDRRDSFSTFVWNNTDKLSLREVVDAYRYLRENCTIHLITDGYVGDSDVFGVDHVYIYEDCKDSLKSSRLVKNKFKGWVPVPAQEQFEEVEKAPSYTGPSPILDNRPEGLAETVKAAKEILQDPTKYAEHKQKMYSLIPGLKELEERFEAFDARMKEEAKKYIEMHPEQVGCDHGVSFDEKKAKEQYMTSEEVRKRWPRLFGKCPKGCGFEGIGYASYAHYIYGDW